MTSPAFDRAGPYRAVARCPVCGEPGGDTIFAAERVPVLCNVLFESSGQARAAATGAIDLVLCGSCGLLWNAAFDEAAIDYSPAYENSLHFSPRFQRFATDLASALVERHDLKGRTALEVGSGKGDFLALLCDAGVASGIGYDPSYGGETPARDDLRFVPSLFPEHDFPDADIVCARHVFEHLSAPVRVLANIRTAIPPGRRVGFYVEVPDGAYLLREVALWDVIYEHPLHFTPPALTRLFAAAGLTVTRVDTAFGGQYLSAEGTTGDGGPGAPAAGDGLDRLDGPGGLDDLAGAFRSRAAGLRDGWAAQLAALGDGAAVLWGAGSKGVSFLATVPGAERLAGVVDINPRKHGRFVPVAGLAVIGPDTLRSLRPHHVVLLNPIYRDEVAAMLGELGVDAELVTEAPA